MALECQGAAGTGCPANWFVNVTPGGMFRNLTKEFKAASLEVEPDVILMLVATNDASNPLSCKAPSLLERTLQRTLQVC